MAALFLNPTANVSISVMLATRNDPTTMCLFAIAGKVGIVDRCARAAAAAAASSELMEEKDSAAAPLSSLNRSANSLVVLVVISSSSSL